MILRLIEMHRKQQHNRYNNNNILNNHIPNILNTRDPLGNHLQACLMILMSLLNKFKERPWKKLRL